MNLLAIETSSEACSVAIHSLDGIVSRHLIAPRQHAQLLLTTIQDLLEQQNLRIQDMQYLAFGCGPGSFTGIRIATSVIQGLAFASDLQVIPVSSLRALAQAGYREFDAQGALVAFDARMGQVYWGAYEIDEHGIMQAEVNDEVANPNAVKLPKSVQKSYLGIGLGWKAHLEVLSLHTSELVSDIQAECLPNAIDVALIAASETDKAVDAALALPQYLRNQVTS